MTARRVAFINEKGGTCKTTLAVNVAAFMAQKRNLRTLLVDLDTQGHAGKSLGVDVRGLEQNVFHYLTDATVPLSRVVQRTAVPNLDLVPSWKQMADFPQVMAQNARRAHRLADRLDELQGYDLVIFDSPPSLGLTTTNILVAATDVVVPVATTYLALDGCAEMVETVRRIAEEYGRPDLRISLVIPTLYRKTALADEVVNKLQEYFPDRISKAPLAMSVAIDEAQSHGKTIWEYAPWSRGATMLQEIALEVERAARQA